MNSIPLVRIEVERMKFSLHQAMASYADQLQKEMAEAIDEAITPEKIKAILDKEVQEAIHVAVSEEIRSFFRYSSPGRKAIKEAVYEFLEDAYPEEKP